MFFVLRGDDRVEISVFVEIIINFESFSLFCNIIELFFCFVNYD